MAKLVIDVEVDDKGHVKLKGIQGNVNDLDGTLKNLNSTANMVKDAFMGIIAALGLRELEQAAQSWMKLSMAQERADNALKMAIMSNRSYSAEFMKATLDQASALQKISGIGNEVIQEGQKMLMTYHRIGTDELPRVTRVMVDLAARTGDIYLAAKALGGVSEGSMRHLHNMGIWIDDNVLKTKGFVGVLDLLEQVLKRQAAVLGEGYNKWNVLGALLGDVRERLGDLLNEVATKSGILNKLIEYFDILHDKLENFRKTPEFINFLKLTADYFDDWTRGLEAILRLLKELKALLPRGDESSNLLELNEQLLHEQKILEAYSGYYKSGKSGTGFLEWGTTKADVIEQMGKIRFIKEQMDKSILRLVDQPTFAEQILAQTTPAEWPAEWQPPNPIVGPTDEELRVQEAAAKAAEMAAKRAAADLARLKEETDRINLTLGVLSPQENLQRDYDEWEKKIKDKAALWDWYVARVDENEQKEISNSLWAEETLAKINEDAIESIVKRIEAESKLWDEQEAKAREILKNRLELEKQAADLNVRLATSRFDVQMEKLNPVFDQAKISKLTGDITQAMKTAYDIQVKLAEVLYQGEVARINKNVDDWKERDEQIVLAEEAKNWKLKELGNEWLEKQKLLLQNANKFWKEFADNLTNVFGNAFERMLTGQGATFENLKSDMTKMLSSMATDIIKQSVIKPIITQAMVEMTGKPQGGYYPSNFVGPLPPGGQYADPYARYAAGAVGAYSLYEQQRQGNLTPVSGMAQGAAYGTAVSPGWGTVIGGAIGLIAGIISDEAKKTPELPRINMVWDVVAGQMGDIKTSWENIGDEKVQEITDAARLIFENQLKFFNRIAAITGVSLPTLQMSLNGIGDIDLTKKSTEGNISNTLELYSSFSNLFGKGFTEGFGKLFEQTYENKMPIPIVGWANLNSLADLLNGQPISGYNLTQKDINENVPWGGTIRGPMLYPGMLEGEPVFQTPSEKFNLMTYLLENNVNWGKTTLTPALEQQWNDFISIYQQKLGDFQTSLSNTIGDAFAKSLETNQFSSFLSILKQSLAQNILASISQMFASQAVTPLMNLLLPAFSMSEKYTQESFSIAENPDFKRTISIENITNAYVTASGGVVSAINNLNPVWDAMRTSADTIAKALGLNTLAVQTSTESYGNSVDEFIRGLNASPLNPGQSIASMMNMYGQLYDAALLDPSQLSKLTDYVQGSLLPGLQGISPNYDESYKAIIAQIEGLKVAWGMPSLNTSVDPGDYALTTTTGQNQGPGFKQMMKEAFQEVIQEKLAAMLLDIADASREEKVVSGSLEITGKIGQLMETAIKNETTTREAVRNA